MTLIRDRFKSKGAKSRACDAIKRISTGDGFKKKGIKLRWWIVIKKDFC
jgi:hypothetical protein